MAQEASFARLVSLACHDIRTPLATVHGFATTLARTDGLGEPAARYVEMIESASRQIAELVEELGLVARIEAGRFEPTLADTDTLELARGAAERLGAERVGVAGSGGPVRVEPTATARAVSALVQSALRHGGLELVHVTAEGATLRIEPITPSSAPVVLAHDLRDLGAAAAVRLIEALGGTVALDGDSLTIALPEPS